MGTCGCWRQDPWAGAFGYAFRITPSPTDAGLDQGLVPLSAAVLSFSSQGGGDVTNPYADLQVGACVAQHWQAVPRWLATVGDLDAGVSAAFTYRISETGGSPQLALFAYLPTGAAPASDPTRALPVPRSTTARLAAWPMTSHTLLASSAASPVNDAGPLLPETAAGTPVFVAGPGPGAVEPSGGRMAGHVFTTSTPGALAATDAKPIHASAWVWWDGANLPAAQIVLRSENVVLADPAVAGWQLQLKPTSSSTVFEVRDQRRPATCPDAGTCITASATGPMPTARTWTFMEVGWSPGGGVCVYVNGARGGTATSPADLRMVPDTPRLLVGSTGQGGAAFGGKVSSVEVDDASLDCTAPTRPVPVPRVRADVLGGALP